MSVMRSLWDVIMDVWSFSHWVWSAEDWNAFTISAARGNVRVMLVHIGTHWVTL